MSCEHCSTELADEELDYEPVDFGEPEPGGHAVTVEVVRPEREGELPKLKVTVHLLGEEAIGYVTISHCPWCGRDLTNDWDWE